MPLVPDTRRKDTVLAPAQSRCAPAVIVQAPLQATDEV